MLPAISSSKATPLVRVPWNEPYEIMKALDAGAYGVIVPMVNTREEAQRAVAACRYPPDGNRSFGPIRAALYGGRGYAKEANTELACIAMIETEDGINNLEDILSTPGLDGVYVGPSDLALALGMAPVGDNSDPKHAAVVQRILDACKAARCRGRHTHRECRIQPTLSGCGLQFRYPGNRFGIHAEGGGCRPHGDTRQSWRA